MTSIFPSGSTGESTERVFDSIFFRWSDWNSCWYSYVAMSLRVLQSLLDNAVILFSGRFFPKRIALKSPTIVRRSYQPMLSWAEDQRVPRRFRRGRV